MAGNRVSAIRWVLTTFTLSRTIFRVELGLEEDVDQPLNLTLYS
jgi:hypothetical protein